MSKGADRATLMARAGLKAENLAGEELRVPFAKYAALMAAAKALSRDPALALHFGEAFDMADISIIGLIARASENFYELIAQMNRFQRLGADVDPLTPEPYVLSHEPTGAWMTDVRNIPIDFPEHTETVFARMICGARRLTNMPLARAVHFKYREPAYRSEYERIFRVPIVFESDRNAMLIEDAWLTIKNPLASRYAFGALSEKAQTLLEAIDCAHTSRAQVERVLMPLLHTGGADMERVAARLGVSRKTLFRKLKAEGVTFEKVLDDLRHQLALRYLQSKKSP